MNNHKIGVIGLGAIGRVILAKMIEHPNFSVVSAWDLNTEICQETASTHSGLEIAKNADELIADPRTSVIYIATPPASHETYVRAAINAGKMVYCEKPLGVNVEASEKLAAEVAASGLANVINFNHGNALSTTFLENEIACGVIGNVAGVDIFIHLTTWPRAFQAHATWLGGREQGGFTREMLSHWIYLSTRLWGKPEIIHASVNYPEDPNLSENRVLAELKFGATPAVINAAVGGAGPIGTEYTIWGENKSYRLHSGGQISSTTGGAWSPELTHIEDIGEEDHKRNLDAASARFSGHKVKLTSIAEGYAVQQIIEKILNP